MSNTALVSWRQSFAVYKQPRILGLLFLGFSAGLPYLLVFSTLSAWLTDYGVSRSTIGFFSWVGIVYSVKVIWAPVVDRVRLPWLTKWLGQRRSWMLIAQLGIVLGLLLMAGLDVANELTALALIGVWVAFCSATQDITIDAYRIEIAGVEQQAAFAASYILGYRLALLVAGAGAFYVAEFASWPAAYTTMAVLAGLGVITTLLVARPEPDNRSRGLHNANGIGGNKLGFWQNMSDAVVNPFGEFWRRTGHYVWPLLLLVSLYRVSDITMGVMANPFYLDLGFTKIEIANVVKFFGAGMSLVGAAMGGVMVVRYGLMKILLLGAILVAVTNLLFAVMAGTPEPSLSFLAFTISVDNFSGGVATVAFIAFLSSLTSSSYTATQYALFSSLMTLPGKFIGGYSGVWVDTFGYQDFFVLAAALGIPAIGLVLCLMIWPPSDKVMGASKGRGEGKPGSEQTP